MCIEGSGAGDRETDTEAATVAEVASDGSRQDDRGRTGEFATPRFVRGFLLAEC